MVDIAPAGSRPAGRDLSEHPRLLIVGADSASPVSCCPRWLGRPCH
ncbi:hypothetical protein [Spirillospora albida]|nr:hypothetical protein [Spirillospora albida]